MQPPLPSLKEFDEEMKRHGWLLIPGVLSVARVDELNQALAQAHKKCRELQVKKGVGERTDGTVHHLVALGDTFIRLLEELDIDAYLSHYFAGKYILNSFGGVINLTDSDTYVMNRHRDVRTYVDSIHLMINVLVMLDDFTLDNGATHWLSGSHLSPETPDETEFFQRADRAVGKKGDILMWDSNLWHATGANHTGDVRRALTLTYTKPFLKQQMDYPRAIGYDQAQHLSEELRQILGYNARVPATLDEWYQPTESRMYKRDQE